jgi:hypothetical protein
MPGDAERLDGFAAALLTRTIDSFTEALADDQRIRETVARFGLIDDAADAAADALTGSAGDIAAIATAIESGVAELAAGHPDLVKLVASVAQAWQGVDKLIDEVGSIALPQPPPLPNGPDLATTARIGGVAVLTDVGALLQTILAGALDDAIRGLTPAAWAFLRGAGISAPDLPILDLVQSLLDDPGAFLWERAKALRRTIDITVAGILSGVRTTSIVATPVVDEPAPSAVVAAVPSAAVILQRVVLRFAADAYDDPFPVTVEVYGTAADPPGFAAAVVRVPGITEPLQLGSLATLAVDGSEEVGLAITGWGAVTPFGVSPKVELGIESGDSSWTFGDPSSLRIELGKPVLKATLDASSGTWGARGGFAALEASISTAFLGPVLGIVLPSGGITLKGSFVVVADDDGVHVEGGIGFTVTSPDTVRLPGIAISDTTTSITTSTGGIELGTAGSIAVALGPLNLSIAGLGLTVPIALRSHGGGNLGLLDVAAPTLDLPTGIGVSIDTPLIRGGGFLRLTDDGAEGALELALELGSVQLTVRAVGVFGTVDGAISFIVVISASFEPGIELFMGLQLTGVGGIFGFNRTLDGHALADLVRGGKLEDLMFPEDLASRAPEIIASVKHAFPARRDQYVVGPILQLGWGRPTPFVTISAGVVFTLPDPVAGAIIGSVRVALPSPDAAIIDIRANFVGTIDFSTGDLYFGASLVRSHIAMFEVDGDLVLRAGSSGFIFSAGGFHPKYDGPRPTGELRRLAVSFAPSPILSIRAEAYFAVTASTVQFGGGLYVTAKIGPFGARGALTADVLIHTEPTFSFTAEITGDFALTFEGHDLLGVRVAVLLEGPGHWHARAHVSVGFLFFSVSGTLDTEWGDRDAPLTAGPAVDVAGKILQALAGPPGAVPGDPKAGWSALAPGAGSEVVRVRDRAKGLHPLGSVRISQTVAPLGMALARFGTNPVAGPNPVTLAVDSGGLPSTEVSEQFAPAQFFDLDDAERLSRPSFVPMPSGVVVEDLAWRVGPTLAVDVVYEEQIGDPAPQRPRHFVGIDEAVFQWNHVGAAGTAHLADLHQPAPIGIRVTPPSFAAASSEAGPIGAAFGPAVDVLGVSVLRDADVSVFADYEAELMHR